MSECNKFTGRLRQLCEGGDEVPCEQSTRYRAKLGLSPLSGCETAQSNVPPRQPDHNKKPPRPKKPSAPPALVGDCLKEILVSLGITSDWCEGCNGRRQRMNGWGVAGCRERIDEICNWLREASQVAGLPTQIKAGWMAVITGTWVNPLDPYRGLVRRAIEMAESRAAESGK